MAHRAPAGRPATRENLAIILEEAARAGGWSSEIALLADETACTYSDLFAGMRRTAACLTALGVRPADRVLTALSDGIEVVLVLLGTWYLGAVAVMANPRLHARELALAASNSDPVLVVCDSGMEGLFRGARAVDPARLERQGEGAASVAPAPVSGADPAYALFTSGTTGEPRLCFHGHRDPLIYQQAFGRPVLGLAPRDVTLSVSKTYFAYGLGNSVIYPLLSGATSVLISGVPSTGLVADHLSRRAIRALFAVPSFYAKMLSDVSADALARVGMAVCAGEVLPRGVEEGLEALGGPVVLNGIGTTEIGQTFASNAPRARRAGTVGRVLAPYQVRIRDASGSEARPGIEGRLLVSGDTLALPVSDARSYRPAAPGSWYETGDVAVLDDDAYLTVLGRHDDVEIVSGINVRPTEIENLITGHPSVADAAVCAVIDKRGASRLTAYVVAARGMVDPGTLEAELLGAARAGLGAYKVPKQVVLVPRLPRTPNGKLRRLQLRKSAAEYELCGVWPIEDHDRDP